MDSFWQWSSAYGDREVIIKLSFVPLNTVALDHTIMFSLEFDWDGEIQENDVFLPIFAYAKDGTTMDMNGINSASYRFEINLEQLIYAEYTP